MTFLSNKKALYRLAILLTIGTGVARILSTYRVFSQTADEPAHIACGMELLQYRIYFMDVRHPPLARIAMALGPYLVGARLPDRGHGDGNEAGNTILNSHQNYWENLTLARLGTLPFFILGCVVVWSWTNQLFGKRAALLSLLAFTLLPPVLGHSGLATNDVAGASTLCLALYWLTLWIENPTRWAAARLGAGVGLAVASKFSALLFLPACAAAVVVLCLAVDMEYLRRAIRKIASSLFLSLVVAYLVISAGYLFTAVPIQASRPHTVVDRLSGRHPVVHDALCAILETPYPAGRAAGGIKALAGHNKAGHPAFFMGEWRRYGWWYFFPVMFLVKTPVPFLLLSSIACVFVIRSVKRDHDWRKVAPLLFALVVLGVSLPARINIGLRHVLAIYPLLSIVAGGAAMELWGAIRRPIVSRSAVAALFAWLAISSAFTHPDYLAYFNFLASDRPERIQAESDLDWGQDLARLSQWLRARGVQEVAISYFGTADLTRADLPNFHELAPYHKTSGWVAISAHNRVIPNAFVITPRRLGMAPFYSVPGHFDRIKPGDGPFAWLMDYKPLEKIGSSIFVYYIPPPQ
jgi:hypothetical protein